MTRRLPSFAFILLTLAVGTVLFHFHGHVLRTPNSVLLSGDGDGLKNYFTYAWHVAHDEDALHYRGSNHPFGEHVFYTDGNPALAWLVRLLPGGDHYAIGILNLLLFLGLLACAWALYALLREFELPSWAAALGAFCLFMLQPQLTRLSGHLSLAHAWMIPLAWWVLLRSLKSTGPWRWALLGTAISILAYLTHPYMGLMIGFFQAALLALVMLGRWRSIWKDTGYLLRTAVLVGLPVLLFLSILNAGMEHPGRPADPGGADLYATRFLSLIVPTNAPLGTPLHEFFNYEALEWESRCYLGLSSLLMLVVIGAVQVGRWTWQDGASRGPDLAALSFAAGFIVLLFAMGEFTGLLGDRIPVLKQFRGMGRFAWVFWYTCTVLCTVRLYHYLFARDRSVRSGVAAAVFSVVVGFYAVEGWDQHKLSAATVGHTPNVFKREQLPKPLAELVHTVNGVEAQAIIPLPLIHTGSEYYHRDSHTGVMSLICPLAHHTGIPLMAGITSRTSLEETREMLALLSPPEYTKTLGARFAAQDLFVVAWSGERLDDDERDLLSRCSPLMSTNAGSLFTISAGDLFRNTVKDRVAEFHARRNDLMACEGMLIQPDATILSDMSPCDPIHAQAESDTITGVVRNYTTLLLFPENTFNAGAEYELSFVFHPKGRNAVNVWLVMEHYHPDGTGGVWQELKPIRSMPMQLADRTIARMQLRIDHPEKVYKFFLKGPDENFDAFTVDHVLLRPKGLDVWRQGVWYEEERLFVNNIPLIPFEDRAQAPSGN